MRAKQALAYALVSKKNPKINALDIFPDKHVIVGKDQKIIKVKITEVEIKK